MVSRVEQDCLVNIAGINAKTPLFDDLQNFIRSLLGLLEFLLLHLLIQPLHQGRDTRGTVLIDIARQPLLDGPHLLRQRRGGDFEGAGKGSSLSASPLRNLR